MLMFRNCSEKRTIVLRLSKVEIKHDLEGDFY